ncbi:hypothetical protein [Streptosporangium sp. NPDC087985]|uniref:hypothetical protein n=1 Tax=Streptosporangium sp. NPDC087985 TaxID=3366196 RepID=UPI0038270851
MGSVASDGAVPVLHDLQAHERILEDTETAGFVTTINVLRRIVANLGGNHDLP